ncbi:hypothetical protein WA026_021379 [Henosepilachna vigintioctopunctata]|uniref:Uncharacterized protein n=1 Tax=Henosepilachna vigintioctopunctata TaxID=420089 RepID=A0AAW1TNP5_9CUCU
MFSESFMELHSSSSQLTNAPLRSVLSVPNKNIYLKNEVIRNALLTSPVGIQLMVRNRGSPNLCSIPRSGPGGANASTSPTQGPQQLALPPKRGSRAMSPKSSPFDIDLRIKYEDGKHRENCIFIILSVRYCHENDFIIKMKSVSELKMEW